MRRGCNRWGLSRGALIGTLLALVAALLSPSPLALAAEPIPPALSTYAWGTKPSGMVVGSFPRIEQEYWDEGSPTPSYTDEPGGLAAWRRGCFYESDCWVRLTSNPTDVSPAWSPSGYRIAFLRGSGDTRLLMVLDTRTGEEQVVLETNATISAPTWSPDEQELAFSRKRWIEPEGEEPYLGDAGLYFAGAFAGAMAARAEPPDRLSRCADGGGLTSVDRSHPQWAPDGRLFYVRDEIAPGESYCRGLSPAAWAPGDESEDVNAFDVSRGILETGVLVEPSPAGDRVVVSVQDLATGVRIVPWSPGGAEVPLEAVPELPSWTPDGRLISVGSEWFDAQTGEELERWVETEGGTVFNPDLPMTPGAARSFDTQCSPGNCLSGLMVVLNGNGVGLGDTILTGAVNAVLDSDDDTILSRRPSGTYAVTATPPAGTSVTAIGCDDTNSTGDVAARTATYLVDQGELVVCTFTVGQPDADSDGFPDTVDPCPSDPTNRCDDDTDGDGLKDISDPCPTDATNTCDDPPPPPPPTRCRSHSVAYEAFVAGSPVRVAQFALNDVRWCSNGTRAVLVSKGAVAYTDTRSPTLAVLMKALGIRFVYKGGVVSALASANGSLSVSGTGKVSFCAQFPVPGSVVRKGFSKVLALLPERVRKRVVDWSIEKVARSSLLPDRLKKKIVILGVAAVLRAKGASDRERAMVESLIDKVWEAAAKGLLSLVTNGACVKGVWLPQVDIAVSPGGVPTVSETGTTAIFTVRPYQP